MPTERLSRKFTKCVKAVIARTKSESSAIAICTKSVLHSRNRTIRSYKRKNGHLRLRTKKLIRKM